MKVEMFKGKEISLRYLAYFLIIVFAFGIAIFLNHEGIPEYREAFQEDLGEVVGLLLVNEETVFDEDGGMSVEFKDGDYEYIVFYSQILEELYIHKKLIGVGKNYWEITIEDDLKNLFGLVIVDSNMDGDPDYATNLTISWNVDDQKLLLFIRKEKRVVGQKNRTYWVLEYEKVVHTLLKCL